MAGIVTYYLTPNLKQCIPQVAASKGGFTEEEARREIYLGTFSSDFTPSYHMVGFQPGTAGITKKV
jgi:hypothetical protein